MVINGFRKNHHGRGINSPVRFLLGSGAAGLLIVATSSIAQQQPVQGASQPQASTVPVPGDLELAKLVWSTLSAVDHANQAGNYSVLRDLSAPGFQANNDPARLTQIFASLRGSGVDLSNALLLAPTYRSTPAFVQPGILRVQGYFGLRPTAINFELYYQWIVGKWKLFGVSIVPATIATEQPPPRPAPAKK
jgi:hypothetical protein